MKTTENQNQRTPETNTPNIPGQNRQNPQTRTPQANNPQNPQIQDPTKQPAPQEDPIRKQPHVDPDPTSPSPEKRIDPYAKKNVNDQKAETNPNDLKETRDKDAYPTGKTRDTSVNESSRQHTNTNPSTEKNRDKDSGIDRENTTR